VILFIRAAVITVRFHDDHIMVSDKAGDVVSLVFIAFIEIRILITASEVPLRPAMIKIDHRISFLGRVKIMGGQKNAEVSDLTEHRAVMLRINNGYIPRGQSPGVK